MSACVVCSKAVEPKEAQYANAWERSRKKFPCCSEACATKFDPDVHWIPAVLPQVVDGDEARRLREMARQRLRGLNEARPVVRELLMAGLAPEMLRFCVAESNASTDASNKQAAGRSALGFLSGLFTKRVTLAESRDQRSERSYAEANADLLQWEAVVRERAGGS